jgi:hypothetical protein
MIFWYNILLCLHAIHLESLKCDPHSTSY